MLRSLTCGNVTYIRSYTLGMPGGGGRRSQCESFDLMCEGAAGSVGPFKLGGLET